MTRNAGQNTRPGAAAALLPGLAAAAVCAGLGMLISRHFPIVSALTVCVLLGVLAANSGIPLTRLRPGLSWGAKHLLRAGIVVLGLRLAVGDIAQLGLPLVLALIAIVTLVFAGTQWIGRLCGLSPRLSLLMATGFSICGASAIAAMNGVLRRDDDSPEDEQAVVTSVTMVTLFGSLAIAVLPALQRPLGLSEHEFGLWVGASVHDVGQTVATASVVSTAALSAAVIVKLTRVVLLAPMVTMVSLRQRRRSAAEQSTETKPPLIPLFVIGFLAMVALRSTGWLPDQVLAAGKYVETFLLAAALFGLGAGVRIRQLIRTGGRAAFVGALSWVLIAGLAYAMVRLLG